MTDRYPVELIDIIRLANGQRVLVRPVLAQDLQLHGPFFDGLSYELAGLHQSGAERIVVGERGGVDA